MHPASAFSTYTHAPSPAYPEDVTHNLTEAMTRALIRDVNFDLELLATPLPLVAHMLSVTIELLQQWVNDCATFVLTQRTSQSCKI